MVGVPIVVLTTMRPPPAPPGVSEIQPTLRFCEPQKVKFRVGVAGGDDASLSASLYLMFFGRNMAPNGQFAAVWICPATEWATADRSSRPDGRLVQVCR